MSKKKTIEEIKKEDLLKLPGPLFQLMEHERLGFNKLDFWEDGEINW